MECFQCQAEDLRLYPQVIRTYQRHGSHISGPESCSTELDALEGRGRDWRVGLFWASVSPSGELDLKDCLKHCRIEEILECQSWQDP